MKPTHIVYNPEGKPEGLYYIPEMPEKANSDGRCISLCEYKDPSLCECRNTYKKAVQAAIASAIKVRDEDKRQIWEHPDFEFTEGKVYELSSIELEVYEEQENEGVEWVTMRKLARIKESKQSYETEDLTIGKKLFIGKVKPKQEEQPDIISILKSKIASCSDSTKDSRARKGAYVDCLVMLQEKQVEPKEIQDELWKEAAEYFDKYETEWAITENKSKFKITRK